MGKLSALTPNASPVVADKFVMVKNSGPSDVLVTVPNLLTLAAVNGTIPYKFSAYKSATTQTISTLAAITFDAEDYDTGSNFSSTLFTAPIAGFYHFDAAVYVSSASTTTWVDLLKNGSAIMRGNLQGSSSGDMVLNGSWNIQLALADTISIAIEFTGGGTRVIQNVSGSLRLSWFSGQLLSAG